jgi:hypothetical protein
MSAHFEHLKRNPKCSRSDPYINALLAIRSIITHAQSPRRLNGAAGTPEPGVDLPLN